MPLIIPPVNLSRNLTYTFLYLFETNGRDSRNTSIPHPLSIGHELIPWSFSTVWWPWSRSWSYHSLRILLLCQHYHAHYFATRNGERCTIRYWDTIVIAEGSIAAWYPDIWWGRIFSSPYYSLLLSDESKVCGTINVFIPHVWIQWTLPWCYTYQLFFSNKYTTINSLIALSHPNRRGIAEPTE